MIVRNRRSIAAQWTGGFLRDPILTKPDPADLQALTAEDEERRCVVW